MALSDRAEPQRALAVALELYRLRVSAWYRDSLNGDIQTLPTDDVQRGEDDIGCVEPNGSTSGTPL